MIHLSEISERRLRTSITYLGLLALGMCASIPGPTLIEIMKMIKVSTSDLTKIYTARSSGYLIGSLAGGVFLDLLKYQHFQIFTFSLTMGVMTVLIPFCRQLIPLICIMGVSGIAMGALDTGTNVWLLTVWEDQSSPYFQALHFFFGLGAWLAPLISGIFLPQEKFNTTVNFEFMKNYINVDNSSNIEGTPPITYAYISVGVVSLIVSLLFGSLFIIKITDRELEKKMYKNPPFFFHVAVLVTVFLLLSVYCGTEIGFGQMIATYAVMSNHKLSQSSASYITSLFWGTFTIFRGFAIFLALKLSPLSILIFDLIVMTSASVILVVFGNTSVTCLWVGCGLLGIGLASFYASTITWVRNYINISNIVGSSFVVASALGEMIAPLTISQYVEEKPQILMYITLGCVIICVLLVFIMWILTSHMPIKILLPSTSMPNQCSERNVTSEIELVEEAFPLNIEIKVEENNV